MATVRELAIKVTGDSISYVDAMSKSKKATQDFYKESQTRAERFENYLKRNTLAVDKFHAGLHNLANATRLLDFGLPKMQDIAKLADDYGQMAIRVQMALESASGSTAEFEQVQNRLFETSQRNARSLDQSQELYINTADAMKAFGLSTDQALDVIETLSNEFTINATSAQKTDSAINALSKSMTKGKIGAQELQTIMTAMPSLMTHVADAMGNISSIDLQKMILSGEVGIQELLGYIGDLKDATTDLANDMPNTIGDGLTKVQNALAKYAGDLNESTGATGLMASGLSLLADNFDTVARAATILTGIGVSKWIGTTVQSKIADAKASFAQANATKAVIIAEKQKAQALQATLIRERQSLEIQKQNIIMGQARTTSMAAQKSLASQLELVESKLSAVMTAEAGATARLTTATNALNSARRTMTMLSGALGGPVGIISMLGVAAASFLTMGDASDKVKESFIQQGDTIDGLIEKYKALGDAGKQKTFKADIEFDAKDAFKNLESQTKEIEAKLKEAAKKYTVNNRGIGFTILRKEDKKLIEEAAKKLDDLNKKLNEGKISASAYSTEYRGIVENVAKATGATNELTSETNKAVKEAQAFADTLVTAKGVAGQLTKDAQDQASEAKKQKDAIEDAKKALEPISKSLQSQIDSYEKITDLERALVFTASERYALLSDTDKIALQSQIEKLQQLQKNAEAEKAAAEAKVKQEKAIAEAQRKQEAEARQAEREREQAQERYNALVLELSGASAKQSKELKNQLDLIDQIAKTEQERQAMRAKVVEGTISKAPNTKISSVDVVGSNMVGVAEQRQELEKWHEEQLALQEKLLSEKLLNEKEYAENVKAITQNLEDEKAKLQTSMTLATLSTFESMTGSIADMFKETAGEASAAYKVMFLASKAASIAQAIINTEEAATKALTVDTTGTMSGIVRGLGYASVGMIASQEISGMAHDGIDNIPREGTWLLDKGERVVDARTNADLKTFLSAKDKGSSGGSLTINVPVTSDGEIDENKSRQLGETIKQMVKSVIQAEQRPGGLLNSR